MIIKTPQIINEFLNILVFQVSTYLQETGKVLLIFHQECRQNDRDFIKFRAEADVDVIQVVTEES